MLTPAERLLALRLRRELLRLNPPAFEARSQGVSDQQLEIACQIAMKETGIKAESIQTFTDRFTYGDLHGNRFIEFLQEVS
jgi:hypothetical protein